MTVPPVFAALSGERVLTMQWLEGCKVRFIAASASHAILCSQHSGLRALALGLHALA